MGLSLLLLARARLAQGDSAGAGAVVRHALTPLRHSVGPEHPGTREAVALADSLSYRASR